MTLAQQTARVSLLGYLNEPAGFINNSDPELSPGEYIFGFGNFQVMEMPVAGVLNRSLLGPHEDFVLGVISVLLIALLTEIVQTILMRTRENRVSRRGLHVAFVLDEVHHFRNLWRLVRRDPSTRRNNFRRIVAYNSLIILAIAGALLAAEVFAVYLTQPVRIYTTESQYNVKGLQPAGTSQNSSRRSDVFTKKRRCITPSMAQSNQSREYSLNACVWRNYAMELNEQTDIATRIAITSWYHPAGSDHRIEFSNGTVTGYHSVDSRATIMQGREGSTKALAFALDENHEEKAQYLQKYFMLIVLETECNTDGSWSCKKTMEYFNNSDNVNIDSQEKEIHMWEIGEEYDQRYKNEKRQGVRTTFTDVHVRKPFSAVQDALHVFVTSSVIKEVKGKGMYINLETGEDEFGIAKLVSEEARVAGLLLLLIIMLALFIFLVLLRVVLRPTSLAELARSTMDDEEAGVDDFFSEPSSKGYGGGNRTPGTSSSSFDYSASPRRFKKMLELGRKGKEAVTSIDGMDSDMDDFQSVVTIESSASSF